MKGVTIVAVIILFQSVFGQELVQIYENYLPQTIIKRQSDQKVFNNLIEMYGELDPDLIYFYMSNLEFKFVKKQLDPDSNWSYQLADRTKFAKHERQRWIHSSIDRINQNYAMSRKKKKLTSYFKSWGSSIAEKGEVVPINIDENKKDFFTYLYFSRQKGIVYDKNTDYQILIDEEISKLTDKFTSLLEEMDHLSRAKRHDAVELALAYPYLFKDTYLKRYTRTTDFPLYEFIYAALKNDYVNKSSVFIRIAEYAGIFSDETFSMGGTIHSVDLFYMRHDYAYKIRIKKAPFITAGLKIKTSSNITLLNYVKISGGLMINMGYSNSFENTVLFQGAATVPGYKFIGEYGYDNYSNFKYRVWTADLAVPLYYFNNDLYIEAGVYYMHSHVSFDYRYYIDGTITSPYNLEPPDNYHNEDRNVDLSHSRFLSIISLIHKLPKVGTVGISYLTPNMFRFSISVAYDF